MNDIARQIEGGDWQEQAEELKSARAVIIRMAELVPFFRGPDYNANLYSSCSMRCEEAAAWLKEHPK